MPDSHLPANTQASHRWLMIMIPPFPRSPVSRYAQRVAQRVSFAVALLILGCSSGSEAPQVHPSVAFVTGGRQSDTVGKTVQLEAKLSDAGSGAPLVGRILNWSVVTGGGTLFVPVSQTGSDGVAHNSLTLGTVAGPQKIASSYSDPESGAPISDTVIVTAVPGAAEVLWMSPESNGSTWTTLNNSGAHLIIYFGFLDQYLNPTTACANQTVQWVVSDTNGYLGDFSGTGFANDTVQTLPVLQLDSLTWKQEFVITGPGQAWMKFEPSSPCKHNVVWLAVRYNHPGAYTPQ
jgi:hypothetical protein